MPIPNPSSRQDAKTQRFLCNKIQRFPSARLRLCARLFYNFMDFPKALTECVVGKIDPSCFMISSFKRLLFDRGARYFFAPNHPSSRQGHHPNIQPSHPNHPSHSESSQSSVPLGTIRNIAFFPTFIPFCKKTRKLINYLCPSLMLRVALTN